MFEFGARPTLRTSSLSIRTDRSLVVQDGHLMARFQVRLDEFRELAHLLHRLVAAVDGRHLDQRATLPEKAPRRSTGVGIIEGRTIAQCLERGR